VAGAGIAGPAGGTGRGAVLRAEDGIRKSRCPPRQDHRHRLGRCRNAVAHGQCRRRRAGGEHGRRRAATGPPGSGACGCTGRTGRAPWPPPVFKKIVFHAITSLPNGAGDSLFLAREVGAGIPEGCREISRGRARPVFGRATPRIPEPRPNASRRDARKTNGKRFLASLSPFPRSPGSHIYVWLFALIRVNLIKCQAPISTGTRRRIGRISRDTASLLLVPNWRLPIRTA